jgi:hypothetical protein
VAGDGGAHLSAVHALTPAVTAWQNWPRNALDSNFSTICLYCLAIFVLIFFVIGLFHIIQPYFFHF